MYIHLGRDYVLNDRDIIGIFNLEINMFRCYCQLIQLQVVS